MTLPAYKQPARWKKRKSIVRDTSRTAFERFQPSADSVDGRILAHLTATHWPDFGATCSELETALGLPHQTASAQLAHLRERGFVRDSKSRRPSASGRPSTVWELGTEDGPEVPDESGQLSLALGR